MPISVAEYLGQRTDIEAPSILPCTATPTPRCPFMNDVCSKLAMPEPKKPVCSVRTTDGTLWIVCKHRLCATKKNILLSNYQIETLHQVAKTVFTSNIDLNNVLVKREERMPVAGRSMYSADFIMMARGLTNSSQGQSRIILEMQGGGETSQTGNISSHVGSWENNPTRTNEILSHGVSGPGAIVTNAWRRQQEQFIVKGNIAIQTGGGLVFCVGTLLYDYLWTRVKDATLRNLRNHNWSLALIGICEDNISPTSPGAIPLKIDTSRLLFTNYPTFVDVLTNQGDPCEDLFVGDFDVLDGSTVSV